MSELTVLVARLPWVTRLDRSQACVAYRWSRMPLWYLDDPGWVDKRKCRNRARWQFEALPDETLQAPSGVFCWQHLLVQLRFSAAEEDRTRKAMGRLKAVDAWNAELAGSVARLMQNYPPA